MPMMPAMRCVLAVVFALLIFGCTPAKRSAPSMRAEAQKDMEFSRYDEAVELYGELVDRDPTRWYDQFALGRAAMAAGDLGKARMALEIASTLRPRDGRITEDLASVLYRLDARDELFRLLKDRAQTTQMPTDWLLLARYAMDCDDPDTARLAVRIGIALDDDGSAAPYLLAAQIARQLGEESDARRALIIAWHEDPENEQVNAMLRDMGIVPGPTLAIPPSTTSADPTAQ
jgi:tetratricopeptide (TPR) repeat protein